MTRDEKIWAVAGAVVAILVCAVLAWGSWLLSAALIARLPQ